LFFAAEMALSRQQIDCMLQRALRAFVLPVALFCCAVAFGQTPDTSTLRGEVLDQTGAAIPGVTITVNNTLTGFLRSAQTDTQGGFSFAGLPIAGSYEITATKLGFTANPITGLTLASSVTADVTIRLTASAGETLVTVTGAVGEVRADQPQLGNHLEAQQVEQTPILNRRITFLPLLNAANHPAINQGDVFTNQFLITTNGSGRRQTLFELDGSNGIDMWGRQTIFSTVPLSGVQEMTVLTNAFSAEYGSTTGGVINVVTRSGGKSFHGDLAAIWRPPQTSAKLSGFTAKNATSGAQVTGDKLGQGAASLSGPISSATRFFASGEYSSQDRTSPVTAPVSPGEFVGEYRGWLALLRLDHQLTSTNNLFFRADADVFHDTNPNGTVGGNTLPNVGRIFKRNTYSASLGDTAAITPTLVNNARLQFQLASPITEFNPFIFGTQFQVPITGFGTFASGTSQSALLMNRQYEGSDTVSAMRGRHDLRFGGSIIHAHNGGNSKEFGGPVTLGQFVFKPCALGLEACESQTYLGNIRNVSSYTQSYGNANYTVDDTLWSAFIQDNYEVVPDVTLNLGLRYERQTFTNATRDVAPRFGFAWNVAGTGKTVVRGGFGLYYSQIPDNAFANYAISGPAGVFNFTAQPGQVGFPSSISAAPLPAFPSGAVVPVRSIYVQPGRAAYYNQFVPVSQLVGYQNALLNPYAEQWTFGVEHELRPNWLLAIDYVGSHTLRINRPVDVDSPTPFVRTAPGQVRSAQAANCTRPLWVSFYTQVGKPCPTGAAASPQPAYSTVLSDVNDGFANYNALDVNVTHRLSSRAVLLASYTWSHTLDNVDPDVPGQNPNDPNFLGAIEYGNAIFDERHRFVISGYYVAPLKITLGGVATAGSGFPYNITTGANNFGDPGATADRPVINGVVVGRNTGRGNWIFDVSPFIEKPFAVTEHAGIALRAEAFNVFNHPNFVGYSGAFGNGAAPPTPVCRCAGGGFGQPLTGVTNQLPARSLQLQVRLSF
jgi:hypothetical protein